MLHYTMPPSSSPPAFDPPGAPVDGELDLTNCHLHSLEGVDLPDDLTALDLTANRLRDVDARILALPDLRRLSFRQNLLPDAGALNSLASGPVLEELVLHDNKLESIPDLPDLTALTRLELSYNSIPSLAPLASLSAPLAELYVAANRVTRIEALEGLAPGLRVLELGSNALPALEGLGGAAGLTALWLGRNRISDLSPSGLAGLSALRVLALPSNRLTSMAGIGCGATPALEELYLSHNGIAAIEGLAALPALRVLDLASNRVSDVSGLAEAGELTDLWLNDNAIASLGSLATALRAGKAGGCVSCAYLAGNPAVDALIAAGGGEGCARPTGLALGYARAARALMPALTELDGDDVEPVLAKASADGGGGG